MIGGAGGLERTLGLCFYIIGDLMDFCMRFKVIVSEGEDGWFVVECPSFPGCVSQGRTFEEALENIKDVIQGCLDVLGGRTVARSSERIIEVEA